MTLRDRIVAYTNAFPGRPPMQVVTEGTGKAKHDVIYGQWVIGNDYRNKTTYYGAYPHGYLDRVIAMFPGSLGPADVLHACDVAQEAEINCRVEDLPQSESFKKFGPWSLVLADPPYSAADAEKYGTGMVDRRRVMAALSQVTRVGGHLVWLDTTWPMHRKDQWRTVGRIGLTRSTNHRVRMVSIFERVART